MKTTTPSPPQPLAPASSHSLDRVGNGRREPALGFCSTCGHHQLFEKSEIHHRLHFVLAILTGGLWSLSWLAVVIVHRFRPWRCQQCNCSSPVFSAEKTSPVAGQGANLVAASPARERLARIFGASALVLLFLAPALHAQVPQLVNYQGRVAVGGVNFSGSGAFSFALVNTNGATSYWSNDGVTTGGAQPTTAVTLTVTNGLYSVLLGDTTITNMAAIPASVWTNADVRLRVWFNDGTHGFQLLTPDQRLAPNGYLPAGSVSSAAITAGAVTNTQLGANAVQAGNIVAGAVGSLQLAPNLTLGGTTDAAGDLSLPATTSASTGVLNIGGSPFIHAYGPDGLIDGNTFVGDNAGNFSTTVDIGYSGINTAVGYFALSANTTGGSNTASGAYALSSNTTGGRNTASGAYALSMNTTGYENTASGDLALYSNTTGGYNTAIGSGALYFNTTGSYNTASGEEVLQSNTTGSNNTASGVSALISNTIGDSNTATGDSALGSNTTASENVAVGLGALYDQSYSPSSTTAWNSRNVAVGYYALFSNQPTSTSTGIQNTALGTQALQNNTAGANNIALGYNAGSNLTVGNANIDIGNAGVAGESNIIRIGDGVTQTDTWLTGVIHGNGSGLTGITAASLAAGAVGSSQLASGLTLNGTTTITGDVSLPATSGASAGVITQAGTSLLQTYGTSNFAAGLGAGNFTTTGTFSVAVGASALSANTSGAGNTALGATALQDNNIGNYNTATGADALSTNTAGNDNTAMGYLALTANTVGSDNTATGYLALWQNTYAGQNVAIGSGALYSQSYSDGSTPWASQNVAVGYNALYANQPQNPATGVGNTALGAVALTANTTGYGNTATGQAALYSNTAGIYNTATGQGALYTNTTGNYNLASGWGALSSDGIGSFNTAEGASALTSNTTASQNVAVGTFALEFQSYNNGNAVWTSNNVAVGYCALYANQPTSNTNGNDNTAIGTNAIALNSTGANNTALGFESLYNNQTGNDNVALGYNALKLSQATNYNVAIGPNAMQGETGSANVTADNVAIGDAALWSNNGGIQNTACGAGALFTNTNSNGSVGVGYHALNLSTGAGNIALGSGAGASVTSGSSNIEIGSPGASGDSGVIRIGGGSQTKAFIAGISGVTLTGASVVVTSSGQLGVTTSSRRFKHEIADMDKASEAILALRPVTFRYKPELDAKGIPQFGLIAEEVDEVNPDLVLRDEKGEIYTVRYEAVNAMLLNEFLKDHRRADVRDAEIAKLRDENAAMKQHLAELEARDQEREARVARLESLLPAAPAPVTLKTAAINGN